MSRSNHKSSLWNQPAKGSPYALIVLTAGLIACVLAWFWQYRAASQEAPAVQTASPVRFNELMSSNKSAVPDDTGAYSDWIELLNPSDQPADITGFMLSDGGSLFTFPQHVLGPGEAVLVYASGTLHAIPGEPYHAPFRLSASGETVTLTDPYDQPVDTLQLPALDPDASYARNGSGEWMQTASVTPGLGNDAVWQPAASDVAASGLVISEVMPDSASYAPSSGDACDWIELYNGSGRDIDLSGFMLSDDLSEPGKFVFPQGTAIRAGQYLLIHASGEAAQSGALHTPFRLSAEGESVILSDAKGRAIDRMSWDTVLPDVSLSRNAAGSWTASLAPTPGFSNDAAGAARVDAALRAQNSYQVVINEFMSSTRYINEDTRASHDWVELYNGSAGVVDLSGWGLSDSASRPRKWQFPAGTSIGPGQYLLVWLSGENGLIDGQYHASFSLSRSEGEQLTLCLPDGTILDRACVGDQHAEISMGRAAGQDGFFLFGTATPGASNAGSEACFGRVQQVAFSEAGGLKTDSFTLTLSSDEGASIYYTTDCTDPTTASARYTGPIEISSTTVVRAIAVKAGYIDSISSTHTYLFGASHALPVVSLVSDPDGMFGEENGMYTNFEELWARDAHIEYFTPEGDTLFSQGMEISLHGNDARQCDQKTFNVIARSEYGDNRVRAALFPNREFTEYQSFLLRPSSEDSNYTRMRCSILSSLLSETTVMYQDTVVAVLYINGEYWGHYNLRERVNTFSIAQREGWSDPDRIDLIKVNDSVMQGSNKTFKALLEWLDGHSLRDEANLEYVKTQVDVENYLDYVMLQIYASNSDLANVKRYRSDEGDGRWRWVVFDLDWAFHNDTNSWADWIGYDGRAPRDGTDTTLFRALMENDAVKEQFFRLLGQRLATTWSSSVIIDKIDERIPMLEPEMEATYAKFEGSVERWREKVELFRNYAKTRAGKLIGYIAMCEDMPDDLVEEYFGEALRANPLPEEN